jgi:hypothetical protein
LTTLLDVSPVLTKPSSGGARSREVGRRFKSDRWLF